MYIYINTKCIIRALSVFRYHSISAAYTRVIWSISGRDWHHGGCALWAFCLLCCPNRIKYMACVRKIGRSCLRSMHSCTRICTIMMMITIIKIILSTYVDIGGWWWWAPVPSVPNKRVCINFKRIVPRDCGGRGGGWKDEGDPGSSRGDRVRIEKLIGNENDKSNTSTVSRYYM